MISGGGVNILFRIVRSSFFSFYVSVLFVLGQGGWKRFYMLHFPKNLPRNELTIFFFWGGGSQANIYPW